jgi:hypothetical protein
MLNVHSVLKLTQTTQHPYRRLEGSKKGMEMWHYINVYSSLLLQVMQNIHEKKSYEHTLPNIWTFPYFCMAIQFDLWDTSFSWWQIWRLLSSDIRRVASCNFTDISEDHTTSIFTSHKTVMFSVLPAAFTTAMPVKCQMSFSSD